MPDAIERDISTQSLKRDYWFIAHIPQARIILRRSFMVFCAALWMVIIISLFRSYVLEYAVGRWRYNDIFSALAQPGIKPATASQLAKGVQIVEQGMLARAADRFDLYAAVANPNATWRADIQYAFVVDGKETPAQYTFIYPGQQKYLFAFDINGTEGSSSQIRIQNIQWTFLTKRDRDMIKERDAFTIAPLTFTPGSQIGISKKLPVSRAQFEITNPTGYGYYDLSLRIVLRNAGQIVGVNLIRLDSMAPNTKQSVEAQWYSAIGNVTDSIVTTDIDVLNPSVFSRMP